MNPTTARPAGVSPCPVPTQPLRTPLRTFCAYALPDGFLPPTLVLNEALAALRAYLGENVIDSPALQTRLFRPAGSGLTLLAIDHGPETALHLRNYPPSAARPTSLLAHLCQTEWLVVDGRARLLYTSLTPKIPAQDFLSALNITLFEGRLHPQTFEPLALNLAAITDPLAIPRANPAPSDRTPWSALKLTHFTYAEAGLPPIIHTLDAADFFPAYDAGFEPWPETFTHLHLAVYHPEAARPKTPFQLDLFASNPAEPHAPILRAALSPRSLPVIAALLKSFATERN